MNTIDINYPQKNIYAIDGSKYRASYEAFKNLDTKSRDKIALLRGHHFFGSHVFLREGATYFTMLREPHSRLASLYNYLRDIDLYKDINKKQMSLGEFLESGLAMAADNGMTRMLTAHDFDTIPNGNINLDHASEAIQNLKQYFVALGLTEDFNSSLLLFQQKLSWKQLPENQVENKTGKKLIATKDVVAFFEANPSYKKYIASDILVYEYAKERFEKEVLLLKR